MHRVLSPSSASASLAMRQLRRRTVSRLLATIACASSLSLPVLADDIDVYTARLAAQKKPNILFVLDYSGSMNEDINNGDASVSGEPTKIEVLRTAMENVLANNVGVIRAGIGSIYASSASGVRWPVSDLDADAHSVDPLIPIDAFSAREVMIKQLYRQGPGGSTRTVNALADAALYFRGGAVANGGGVIDRPDLHRPDTWNASRQRYAGGNRNAAIEASYSPNPAYWRDVYEAGNYGWCDDYTASGGNNNCEGKTTYDCRDVEGGSYVSSGEGSSGETYTYDGRVNCRYEHPDAWHGASYDTPIEGQCEANALVLISDGLPSKYSNNEALRTVLGDDPSTCEDLSTSIFTEATVDNGDCGPEIVNQLATMPQVPGIDDSIVNTYTVGFGVEGIGKDYLDRLAYEGSPVRDGTRVSPEAFSARNLTELNAALAEIVRLATDRNESFTELSVDIDKASFSHDNRAYFSLFSPAPTRGWQGNLKGYFLDSRGLVDTNNAVALESGGSNFAGSAQSFWSATPDGNDPLAGGASARLATSTRSLYTYDDALDPVGGGAELSLSDAYRLHADNTLITAADLGVDDAERTAALDWLQTAPMGDPLHSKSVSVNYGTRQVVYVMTNQGLLHAIDATLPSSATASDYSGGGEIFAFMPKRLLANLPILARGDNGTDHVYGLDGPITRWHTDDDNNGVVNGDDTVLLIFGMRRGGDAYYAMDVTNPEQPILKWVIDSTRTNFADLAQSWSRMALINVKRTSGDEQLLVFGGGYDAATNDDTDAHVPAGGNAIYLVDRDGAFVKRFDSTDHSDMRFSIPADLTPVDVSGDGLTDRIYAADVGGQLWRIDIDNIDQASDTTVTRLANLAGTGFQPFFSAPSVALNTSAHGEYLSVSVGSGNRTDPLDTDSGNAFFMVRDVDVEKGAPSSSFSTVMAGDLYDATANRLASSDATVQTTAQDALALARGWRIDLDPGEKSLTRLVSFENHLYATTFAPSGTSTDPCAVPTTSHLYRMDISTGAPFDFTPTESTEFDASNADSRRLQLDTEGIPSAPAIVFTKGSSNPKVFADRKPVDEIPQTLTRVYWHAR